MFPATARTIVLRNLWAQTTWRILAFFMVFLVTFGIACKPSGKKNGPPKPFTGKTGKVQDKGDDDDDDDDKKSKGKKGDSGFLKDSDFPDNENSLSRSSFISALTNGAIGAEVTEHFDAGAYTKGTPSGACSKENAAAKAKASDKSLTFELEESECSGTSTGETANAKGVSKYTCQKSAFAKFDGKKKSDLKDSPIAELCASSKLTFIKNYIFNSEIKSGNNVKSLKSKRAFTKSDGSPCEVEVSKSSFKILSGCSYYYTAEVDVNSGDETTYTFKGLYKSAKAEFESPYFTDGSVEFTLNNWKGTITFNARGREFSATSSEGEKASGSLR